MSKHKSNLEFIKEQITTRMWTFDCGGKQDLDMPILSISTRYWADFTAQPSFLLGDDSCDSDITYKTLLESDDYIKGKNEKDCKLKVKRWYKNNLLKALQKLLEE